ncbi:MAG: energy-coupling factor ABC transporter permease [Candidatus Omnitrophica bacterium]|nr:energy-coupling factor ABC transporter permease [Candidatus Omnitrophota bacterium]
MHICDGLMPFGQTLFYLVIALIFVILSFIMTLYWANKELNKIKVIMLVVLVPVIFALQALSIPIAWGTSGHMVGAAMAAIILGSPFPVILLMTLILLAQAILFADGGIAITYFPHISKPL